MPNRRVVATELSGLMKVLAHPDRILIVQLLATRGEHNVGSIADSLALPATRVSQHLATLKSLELVTETALGRERIYALTTNSLAMWLVEGVGFIATPSATVTNEQLIDALELWLAEFSPAQSSDTLLGLQNRQS